MRAKRTIDPTAPGMRVDQSKEISDPSCPYHPTPSADSKKDREDPTNGGLSESEDGDGAKRITVNSHCDITDTHDPPSGMNFTIDEIARLPGPNCNQTISTSPGPTARSKSAESVGSDPRAKLVGGELTFEEGTHFSHSEEVDRLAEDRISAVLKKKAGDTLVLLVHDGGHIVVKALLEEQLVVAHSNTANELIAAIIRAYGNHNQSTSAVKKTADDQSSLLFHRTELIKAKTLDALTRSRHIACYGCPKKEPAATADNMNPQSLSSLINRAKAKIHHDLTAPEHTGYMDSSSTSSALSEEMKPKKKAKKVRAAEMDGLRFHKVLNHVQFCVIVLLFFIIIGLGSKGVTKKDPGIGSWLGA